MQTDWTDQDLALLRESFALARQARARGDQPFGALLVDADGNVRFTASNTTITARDVTAHAETNLVRMATARFTPAELATWTLYTSTEPCAMCAGAIHWAGIGRVVYGLSAAAFHALVGPSPKHLELSCREVFARSGRPIAVVGPLLEDEARQVHLEPPPEAAQPAGIPAPPVHELRVALTVADFDAAVRFYRDGLGLAKVYGWDNPDGRGVILAAGRATLELIDDAQADLIDRVEAGRRVSGPVRLALEVTDVEAAAQAGQLAGARLLRGPVVTPWGHRNARLAAPDGMQLTFFEVLANTAT